MCVIKWTGGKKQLLPEIKKRLPFEPTGTYCEPFLGGAAVLLELQPAHAIINDANPELINMYQVIRDNPNDLIIALKQHKNTKEHFYSIRNLDRNPSNWAHLSSVDRAARFIYINKTCFNGLMRVNQQGQLNTSFGSYVNPQLCPEEDILKVHQYLRNNNVEILCGDFGTALDKLRPGDFAYLDPPYAPASATANYTAYTSKGFSVDDQIRLSYLCRDLDRRGVKWLLSNSSVPLIHELYADYIIDVVPAKRAINCKGNKRGPVNEVLIRNYSIPEFAFNDLMAS